MPPHGKLKAPCTCKPMSTALIWISAALQSYPPIDRIWLPLEVKVGKRIAVTSYTVSSCQRKRRHCDRATSFDLLPMASGESEGNHILLGVAAPLAKLVDSLAKSFEEFGVIYHGL